MTTYQVTARSTVFGLFDADDEQAACDMAAQDAGYKSEADMGDQLEQRSELVAFDIRRYANNWSTWAEYIDPDATVSREEWDAMDESQRMELVRAVLNANG